MERLTNSPVMAVAPKLGQGRSGLQGKHTAGKKAGQDDDGQGADPDRIRLGDEVREVVGTLKDVRNGAAGKQGIVLHRRDTFFLRRFQVSRLPYPSRGYHTAFPSPSGAS